MPYDLARIETVTACTELKIGAQTARLQAPEVAPWMRDAIHRRLLHLRQDLDTFQRTRGLIIEDGGDLG